MTPTHVVVAAPCKQYELGEKYTDRLNAVRKLVAP